MSTKPGMVRSIPGAIVYAVAMTALSVISAALIGVAGGVLVGVFVVAYRWVINLF